ncbi:MAG TPA: FAD-binding protein [Candidatus Tectomicrobia bacterium]|nr:FAD-binding protein [Candidatus Tectomicrobia bacterium]
MPTKITNYDGGIVTVPQQLVRPESVEEVQAILRDTARYPSPVRAMGSFHSLTPCVSSSGTIVSMSGLKKIQHLDPDNMTLTAQAGLQIVEAAEALRRHQLQLMLNIEIGNMTLGSAACCQTKDSLDGVEYGQVNSYVTGIKWVNPAGGLEEASEEKNPELLSLVRSSYGLGGIVYEVTLKIKPLEVVKFDYFLHDVDDLTQDQVSQMIASNESIVMWTVGRTVVIQTRNRTPHLKNAWVAAMRRFSWSHSGAFVGRAIRRYTPGTTLTTLFENLWFAMQRASYGFVSAIGGFSLYNPDKIINYAKTPPSARYAFTFWAFPRADWVSNLKAYLEFSDNHFKKYGFRCNIPLGSYFIRQDTSSQLSYSYNGDIISLDPIHAYSERDKADWEYFLQEFNAWAHSRGGIPLLNQSPFVEKEHVVAAYGDRWKTVSDWVRTVDPQGRMLNPFFKELLS